MKPSPLLLFLCLFLISGAGCVQRHSSVFESTLAVDSPDFTRATGIDHLGILPTPVPEVSVAVRKCGRYRCQIWSHQKRHEPVCLSDSGYVAVTAPSRLHIVVDHDAVGSHLDYIVEISYLSDGGESSRLVKLVAAWW